MSKPIGIKKLINKLKKIRKKISKDNNPIVIFDFVGVRENRYIYPSSYLCSYRGFYEMFMLPPTYTPIKLNSFIKVLEANINTTVYGWKGGEYETSKNTIIYIAEEGNVSDIVIVGVVHTIRAVVLETKHYIQKY